MDNPIIAGIFLILFAIPAYYFVITSIGILRGIIVICILNIFALGIETYALQTGFPYGQFSYSNSLGYKIFGLTPWSVGLSWSMILIGATAITQRYIKKRILHVPVIVILLLITDLVLDPGAVALNYWSYSLDNLPHFYGVPLSNFLGWILSGSIGSLLFLIFAQQKISSKATVSLLLIAVFWTGVDIYKGLYIPAFVGVVLTVICFITVWGSESVKE